MARNLIFIAMILRLATSAFATSGIAVSMHSDTTTRYEEGRPLPEYMCNDYPWKGKIWYYDIQDDQVVNAGILDTADTDQSCSRWATLKTDGSKCAFFRLSSNTWYLSVINIDGTNRRDLVNLTADTGDGFGYMDWPKGNWIYYNCGGNGADNSSAIFRVNDSTGEKERIATLPYRIWVWSLSANADRMTARVQDVACADITIARFDFPSGASLPCSDPLVFYQFPGCTNNISPSGNCIFYTIDGGHVAYMFGTWESSQPTFTMSHLDYNAWAVNTDSFKTMCEDGLEYTVGHGSEENRYSANSDKWVCFNIGWQPDGRYYNCGGNQVLINWQDKKTIMVSFNKRACNSFYGLDSAFCPGMENVKYRSLQEAGDFVVFGPDSEINEDMRPGASISTKRASAFQLNRDAQKIASSRGIFRLNFDSPAARKIELYNLAGKRLVSALESGSSHSLSLPSSCAPGLYTLKIRDTRSTQIRKIILRR